MCKCDKYEKKKKPHKNWRRGVNTFFYSTISLYHFNFQQQWKDLLPEYVFYFFSSYSKIVPDKRFYAITSAAYLFFFHCLCWTFTVLSVCVFMQIKRKLDLSKHHASRLKSPHDVFNTLYTVIMLLKKQIKVHWSYFYLITYKRLWKPFKTH